MLFLDRERTYYDLQTPNVGFIGLSIMITKGNSIAFSSSRRRREDIHYVYRFISDRFARYIIHAFAVLPIMPSSNRATTKVGIMQRCIIAFVANGSPIKFKRCMEGGSMISNIAPQSFSLERR